jgi:MFS family permease
MDTIDIRTYQKRNTRGFLIHALFLALTLNFIDHNTVVPAMLAQAGGAAWHMGLLSAILVGGTKFMQLPFASLVVQLKQKKGALLIGIYIRTAALITLGLFIRFLGSEASWKVWMIIGVMTVFSFSGAFANIAYTDIMGKVILPEKRKRLIMIKQLISSIGVILSALLVKVILSQLGYPYNFSLLFLLAGALLLLGTSGFWMLVEPPGKVPQHVPPQQKFRQFWTVLHEDRNLRWYLMLINTTGVIISLLPFLILYARNHGNVDGNIAGNFLLVQMAGALGANILFTVFSKDQRYRSLMYLFVGTSTLIPLTALMLSGSASWYALVFLLGGIAHTLNQIISSGVLLEISTDENRALYTGLSGAGSVMQVLYPIVAGILIDYIGYTAVFYLSAIYVALGWFAARSISCNDKT